MCYFWWVAFCPEQEGGVVQLRAAQFLSLMGVCVAGDGGDQWCCSVGSSLKWHSPRDVELHSQGGTLGCFPSSSAALLQDSGSVKQTWVGFFPSVLCFFNKWFIALQHTRGSEGPVPLERAVLCAAAGCSLMDPCYAADTAAWAGKQFLGFHSVNPSMEHTKKHHLCKYSAVSPLPDRPPSRRSNLRHEYVENQFKTRADRAPPVPKTWFLSLLVWTQPQQHKSVSGLQPQISECLAGLGFICIRSS